MTENEQILIPVIVMRLLLSRRINAKIDETWIKNRSTLLQGKKGPRRRKKLPESRGVTVDPCDRERLESLLLFSQKKESLFGWMQRLCLD